MTVKYPANCMSKRQQRVVIGGFYSECTTVTSGVPQGSILGPTLFIIYITDGDVGINNLISKFANDTKIGNSVLTDEERQSLKEDLHKISAWSDRWETPLYINKCQIFQVGIRNKTFDYEIRGVKLNSIQSVNDLGVKITLNLKFSQQCIDVANKASRMLGFIRRNFLFKNINKVILRLYNSLVIPRLEYAVQFGSPTIQRTSLY